MELRRASGAAHLHGVPAAVPVGSGAAYPRRTMERLMHITDQVQQPGQIVGLQWIGTSRREDAPKQSDPLLSVRGGDRRRRRSICGERDIHKMPVLMFQ